MNPTAQPIQGMQGLLGKTGTAPKLNLQKLKDAYDSIQELRMFASPTLKQILDQIPNPIHPDYQAEPQMEGMGQMGQGMMGGMMEGNNGS